MKIFFLTFFFLFCSLLVFDESGSISASNFRSMIQFGQNFGRSFTFGRNNIAMGLVMFSSTSYIRQQLTTNQSLFLQTVNTTTQKSGSTCIGCGFQSALSVFNTTGRVNTTRVKK